MNTPSKHLALRLVFLSILLAGANSVASAQSLPIDLAGFKTNTRGPRADIPLTLIFVGPPPEGMTNAQVDRAMKHAASQWSSVPCADLTINVVPAVETIAQVSEGMIPVQMVDTNVSGCIPSKSPPLLAVAPCQFAPRRAGIALNKNAYRWVMLEDQSSLIALSSTDNRPTEIDLKATLTHELGHILGLAHPEEGEDAKLTTMYGRYQSDGGQATLSADDRAGICSLYPQSGPQTSTCSKDTTCQTRLDDPGATCKEVSPGFRVCEQEQGFVGSYCALSEQRCPGFCLITSEASQTGYCTKRCESDATCSQEREGWVCTDSDIGKKCAPLLAEAEELDGCMHSSSSGGPARSWWWAIVVGVIFWTRRQSSGQPAASRRTV